MKKKTIILTIILLILFVATSVGVFFGVYNIAGRLIRSYPELFTEEESYSSLTKEKLESIPDEELEYEIINDIWYNKLGEDSENEYELFRKLPQSSKYIYATWTFENEFYNGGFVQFFYNYSGQFAQEAMEGYKYFGLPEHVVLMSEAIEIYNKEKVLYENASNDESTAAFTNLYKESKIVGLDEKFDSIVNDASELRIKYIRAHIDEFVSK